MPFITIVGLIHEREREIMWTVTILYERNIARYNKSVIMWRRYNGLHEVNTPKLAFIESCMFNFLLDSTQNEQFTATNIIIPKPPNEGPVT